MDEIDGWGFPFPPHSQLFHWQHVKSALDQHELDKQIPIIYPPQPDWKDLPAGHWDKTPKDVGGLDG